MVSLPSFGWSEIYPALIYAEQNKFMLWGNEALASAWEGAEM